LVLLCELKYHKQHLVLLSHRIFHNYWFR